MRKLFGVVFTSVLAAALLVVGTPAANAFGSEVLGCSFDSASWTANACEGGGYGPGVIDLLRFSAHNLSGTYSMQWNVYNDGNPITVSCSTGVTRNCIENGCTSTSTTCAIETQSQPASPHYVTANLRLTQSGQTRVISATATVDPNCSGGVC